MTTVRQRRLVLAIARLNAHSQWLLQDPGNLEADLQAGGFAGYALLWLFLWCTAMVRDAEHIATSAA